MSLIFITLDADAAMPADTLPMLLPLLICRLPRPMLAVDTPMPALRRCLRRRHYVAAFRCFAQRVDDMLPMLLRTMPR